MLIGKLRRLSTHGRMFGFKENTPVRPRELWIAEQLLLFSDAIGVTSLTTRRGTTPAGPRKIQMFVFQVSEVRSMTWTQSQQSSLVLWTIEIESKWAFRVPLSWFNQPAGASTASTMTRILAILGFAGSREAIGCGYIFSSALHARDAYTEATKLLRLSEWSLLTLDEYLSPTAKHCGLSPLTDCHDSVTEPRSNSFGVLRRV